MCIFDIFDIEGQNSIFVIISTLSCFGMPLWIIYGGNGLASFPLNLLKSKKSIKDTKSEVFEDLAQIRQKYRGIQESYSRSHRKLTKKDERELSSLKKKEKHLNAKS